MDLRPLVVDLAVAGPRVALTLRVGPAGSTRPTELLACLLGDAYPGDPALRVVRTALLTAEATPLTPALRRAS